MLFGTGLWFIYLKIAPIDVRKRKKWIENIQNHQISLLSVIKMFMGSYLRSFFWNQQNETKKTVEL